MASPVMASVVLCLLVCCMAIHVSGQDDADVAADGDNGQGVQNATPASSGTETADLSGLGDANADGNGTISELGFLEAENVEVASGEGVFNVVDYGADAQNSADSTKAFADTWKATCAYQGNSTFLVPAGTFVVGPLLFQGPCFTNTLTQFIIKGTLKALPDLSIYTSTRWFEFSNLHNLVVKGRGTFDGQGAQAWAANNCKEQKKCKHPATTLRFTSVNNALVTDLNIVNSMGFHVNFHRCTDIETRFLNISAPGDSPNTDGIHISATVGINVTHTNIATGDDCISLGPGAIEVKIANVTCGPGHGISVGSLGRYNNELDVYGVKVRNCTLTGTTNGLRIKTWPGGPASKAYNLTFEDIILNDVANPIIIDQEYCPARNCKDAAPSMVKLQGITFRRVTGTSKSEVAVHMVCSQAVPCEDVQLEDIQLEFPQGQSLSTCANVQAAFQGSQKPSPCGGNLTAGNATSST